MNKEKLNKLQEVINDQLDLIEMNVARINNKDYFGLDFELLKYIRNLENQLDIANEKLDKINKTVSSYGIQSIPSGLGECPVEVPAHELHDIYKQSIIGGNNE